MKSIVLAATGLTAAGLLLAGPTAVAAPGHTATSTSRTTTDVTVAAAAPTAVTPSVAYNSACGTGYAVIDSLPLQVGTIYLTYSSATGNNCVVTIRSTPGTAVPMVAEIKRSTSSTWVQDSGNYTTYAGPVYLHAPGECIDWGGAINSYTNHDFGTHCG